MIQKDYVLMMARYNAWQNNQLRHIVKDMDMAELTLDRGAFFGSIFATLNHILFADRLWMARWCNDVPAPAPDVVHTEFTPTIGVWDAERFRLDGRIRIWAQTLSNMDLREEVEWTSKAMGKTFVQPMGMCAVHVFNHQTHHRGQISQMLNAAGIAPPVSDVAFMPEDA